MKLIPWEPDVITVVERIKKGDIDLQPDFQRGEVWPKTKKQKLIDSILRDWHVPPIHVVESKESGVQEVLDGQQRLTAIRDFVNCLITVDGFVEPVSDEIRKLDGLHYSELPQDVRRRFDNFTLRIQRVVEHKPEEAAELFYRLNQPTNLTGAEQRNAFFGLVRQQIRDLVSEFEMNGLDKRFVGFSNSRMAYDDVISRFVVMLERGRLDQKVASGDLVSLYRSTTPISETTIRSVREVIGILGETLKQARAWPKFNKATLLSWMLFIVRGVVSNIQLENTPKTMADFLEYFDEAALSASIGRRFGGLKDFDKNWTEWLLATYEDRSTSRVADVSSVVLRDAVLWIVFLNFLPDASLQLLEIKDRLYLQIKRLEKVDQDALSKILVDSGWGALK
jgi:hypothetical protein